MTTKTNNAKETTMTKEKKIKGLAEEFVGQMSADDLRGFSREERWEGVALHIINSDGAEGIQIRDLMNAIEDAVRAAKKATMKTAEQGARAYPCPDRCAKCENRDECEDERDRGEIHGGLQVLENLNLRMMRKALGENGAIELISALISKRALSSMAALEMVEDSGLL